MRLRLPELLDERGLTGYQVGKASGGRLSLSAVYSLLRRHGRFERVKAEHLDAFCDVLGVEPGELLERAGEHQIADATPQLTRRRKKSPARGGHR